MPRGPKGEKRPADAEQRLKPDKDERRRGGASPAM
jgi:hypothetical protein